MTVGDTIAAAVGTVAVAAEGTAAVAVYLADRVEPAEPLASKTCSPQWLLNIARQMYAEFVSFY
jgi:hypothetical protein